MYSRMSDVDGAEQERLIGWRGETYKPGNDQPWIETIAWKPRAFVYHDFLSHDECDHLIHITEARLERSLVIGDHGEEMADPIRTSYSASLGFHEDAVVTAIENRIAAWTHLPAVNGEPIEVLRYKNGQKYDAHWDWFDQKELERSHGQRLATVLMYLTDVEDGAGGETALPLADAIDEDEQDISGYSECASRMGISVRPRKL